MCKWKEEKLRQNKEKNESDWKAEVYLTKNGLKPAKPATQTFEVRKAFKMGEK